jgi:membrane-bound lytic murein transglycosylase F
MPGYPFSQVLSALLLILMLQGCSKPTVLEKIKQEGILHVITRNGPITYYEGKDGPAGYEFELASMLAEHMDVELRIRVVPDLEQIYQVTEQNYTHLAAVGISLQSVLARNPDFRLSDPFLEFKPLVLYRKGQSKPRDVGDLMGKHIVVHTQSAEADYLNLLQESQYPELSWQLMEDAETAELMRLIQDGSADIAIVNSIEYAVNSALFPQVQEAFPLMDNLSVSWVLPPGTDNSLLEVVNAFLHETREQGKLIALQEHYYSHVDQLDYVGASTYMRHIRDRLPMFIDYFKEAGTAKDLDWRLLAAIGYQESHWQPYATSPTGVRGMMMLTQITAKEVGVENRLDPAQSIRGGAEYFVAVKQRLSEKIEEPHRTWFALAAYNVGLGHLEDARKITEQQGYNPDIWEHVKKHLPLLQQKKWFTKTRYGYARGWEPVHYVQNIRRYYEVLSWKIPEEIPVNPAAAEIPLNIDNGIQDSAPELPDPFQVTPPTL